MTGDHQKALGYLTESISRGWKDVKQTRECEAFSQPTRIPKMGRTAQRNGKDCITFLFIKIFSPSRFAQTRMGYLYCDNFATDQRQGRDIKLLSYIHQILVCKDVACYVFTIRWRQKCKNIIETQNLTRHFGKLTAVESVDLKVPEASVYGFLGPNGAGKTTTIRMLLGLIKPDPRAEVNIFGKSIRKERLEILGRLGALVEQPAFYPHLTGCENLEIIRRMRGLPKPSITEALAIVKLEDAANRLAKHYSSGMKQRLGLAIALMGQPELLILDEPTNGLDPAGIHEMRELIVRLPEEFGITVFLSSHLLSEVEHVATQIGIIQKGRLIFQGNPESLQAQLNEFVIVSVDQPEKAKAVLAQAGWNVQRNGSQKLYVDANGQSDAALINTQLLGAGVSVYQISLERPSLEDIFLKLTGEKMIG